jgi:cobalt-zinc-cadmium efflux system protein
MQLVLGITFAIFVAEVIGAYFSHSLVLLADAGHMLADVGGIALALFAIFIASRPPSDKRTFGYQRAEIVAAAFNALILLGLSGFIIVSGVIRLMEPPQVESNIMIVFGIIALVGNACALLLLRAGQKESLNVHGAFLEVLSDMLGAAAVIVAALVIIFTGWLEADAVASLLIGVLIIPRTFRLLRESFDVLLEATPRNIDLAQVRKHILEVPGVKDAHDLHAWLITSGVPVLSAHITVEDPTERNILHKLQECLKEHFDVEHSTFQIEGVDHKDHEHGLHK